MMYPNHGFTLVTLFFFLVGLFVNDSWARDAPLNTEPTLNANNFRFDLSGSIRKQDHALASRAVDLGPRDLYSDYATYSAKGNRLICLTKMDDAAAAAKLDRDPAAEYTTVAEMEAAGWVSSTDKLSAAEIADANTKMEGYLSGTLMSSIGVDLSNNELVDWRWTVGEDGVLTAEDLEENTGETAAAQYQNWYNVQGGLIIVNLAWSPGYVVGQNSDQEWWPEDVTDDTVTALNVKQLSDVMYIEWASQATDVTSLEYVIPLNVVNPGTRSAMTLAMASVASTWSTPEVFYPGSEAFDALVGSPNGNAQAWILINHKAQLGVKTISSIRVWTSSTIKAGQPNVFPDTEEWAAEADKRNMCYIYYDDPEEDGILEYDGDAYWGAM